MIFDEILMRESKLRRCLKLLRQRKLHRGLKNSKNLPGMKNLKYIVDFYLLQKNLSVKHCI